MSSIFKRTKFSDFLKNTRIEVLNVLIICIAILFVYLGTIVDDIISIKLFDIKFAGFMIGIIIFSFSGILQVYRREAPGFINPIRGKLAVVNGWLVFISCILAVIILEILHFQYTIY
jgi:hypothetical protein